MTQTTIDMTAALVAGAEQSGANNIKAAVHLLTFTDLPPAPPLRVRAGRDWRGRGRDAD